MLIYNLLCIGIDMINIGICGLGTVGQSSLEHIVKFEDEIRSNISTNFRVSHVADLDVESKNLHGLDVITSNNAMDLAKNPDISIIIELIGGTTTAYEVICESIKNKKHVITANKALIAEHGDKIFKLAKEANTFFGFEASVAGAIPIITALTHNMLNEKIFSIFGIINGTCNYVLDQMATKNLDFKKALEQAQSLGYAEADPSFDIGGNDAAHKISILASLIYKIPLPYKKTYIEGIENIAADDFNYVDEFNLTIKHLAVTKRVGNEIELRSHPVLINKDSSLGGLSGVRNGIQIDTDLLGEFLIAGSGAGKESTASGLISDLLALSKVSNSSPMNYPHFNDLPKIKPFENLEFSYYVYLEVQDQAGVLALVSQIFSDNEISIDKIVQKDHLPDAKVPVVVFTDLIKESQMQKALENFSAQSEIHSAKIIRIEA